MSNLPPTIGDAAFNARVKELAHAEIARRVACYDELLLACKTALGSLEHNVAENGGRGYHPTIKFVTAAIRNAEKGAQ